MQAMHCFATQCHQRLAVQVRHLGLGYNDALCREHLIGKREGIQNSGKTGINAAMNEDFLDRARRNADMQCRDDIAAQLWQALLRSQC